VFLLAPSAQAYELATHAALTDQAYTQSSLNLDATLLPGLGIDLDVLTSPKDPFGTIYYDVSGTTVYERSHTSFEDDIINVKLKALGVQPLSLPGWLLRGAIREDDMGYVYLPNTSIRFTSSPQDPHDDAYGPVWRSMNHFFDPVNDIPLTLTAAQAPGVGGCQDACRLNIHAASRCAHGPVNSAGRLIHTLFGSDQLGVSPTLG